MLGALGASVRGRCPGTGGQVGPAGGGLGLAGSHGRFRGKRPAVARFAGSSASHGLWPHVRSLGHGNPEFVPPPRALGPGENFSRCGRAACPAWSPQAMKRPHVRSAGVRVLGPPWGSHLTKPTFSVRAAGRRHLTLCTLLLFTLFFIIMFLLF